MPVVLAPPPPALYFLAGYKISFIIVDVNVTILNDFFVFQISFFRRISTTCKIPVETSFWRKFYSKHASTGWITRGDWPRESYILFRRFLIIASQRSLIITLLSHCSTISRHCSLTIVLAVWKNKFCLLASSSYILPVLGIVSHSGWCSLCWGLVCSVVA